MTEAVIFASFLARLKNLSHHMRMLQLETMNPR